MGRKADPRGKDRPRTIVLSGDVAEIAQKLADKGELSSTLSDLLRQQYGFGTQLEERKRALSLLLDEKQRLTELADVMADEIDALEEKTLQQNATIRPALLRRKKILTERFSKTMDKAQMAFDPQEKVRLDGVLREINTLINQVNDELEALD